MIPSIKLKSVGPMPLERFVTTYSFDYRRREPRCEAAAAPALIIPPQPPSCSLFPACLHPPGIPAPSTLEATAFAGTFPTEARTQEVEVAREIGPLLGEEPKGQLHYVFGEKEKMLEQLEAKDVLYEEGVIAWSSQDGPVCLEDLLKSVCREAPVASSPVITTKDADCNAYLAGLKSAVGQKNSTFVRSTPRQCSCSTHPLANTQPTYCAKPSRRSQLTEYQARYNAECALPKMKNKKEQKNSTFVQSTPKQCSCSTHPLANAQPTYCTEPSRNSQLTEYQARYTAKCALPKMKNKKEQKNSTFVQSTPKQCSCLHSSTVPLANTQPTYCTEPSRNLQLTEYQARYNAKCALPKIHHPPHH